MNRHDREKLLDGPAVRHALKKREIAKVGAGQHGVEPLELFGKVLHVPRHLLDLAANRPEQILRNAALVERKITEAEQVQRRIERLLRVVIGLEKVSRIHGSERFRQI